MADMESATKETEDRAQAAGATAAAASKAIQEYEASSCLQRPTHHLLVVQEVHSDEDTLLGRILAMSVCHAALPLRAVDRGKLGKIVETLADMETKREETDEKELMAGAAKRPRSRRFRMMRRQGHTAVPPSVAFVGNKSAFTLCTAPLGEHTAYYVASRTAARCGCRATALLYVPHPRPGSLAAISAGAGGSVMMLQLAVQV